MKSLPARILKPVRLLLAAAGILCQALLILWALLAIHHLDLLPPWVRISLAAAFAVFSIVALWIRRGRKWQLGFTAAYLVLLAGWTLVRPSLDRPWKPEVAVMPRATVEGDRLRITGFRNFNYRTRDEFDIVHETRDYDLSRLESVDFLISYWKPGPIGHTFVSFRFADGPPLCISIEVRPETGENFDPVGSMFKKFELIHIAGDERDLIGSRVSHRNEDVFLFPTRASRDETRRLLEKYLERMNELAEEPEFYHLLSNSCTVNILRYARAASGRDLPFDRRHLLNGLVDQYLYSEGIIDNHLPFAEFKRLSRVNDAARAAADSPDFSDRIRAGLPSTAR